MDATWDKADWKPTIASQFVKKKAPEPAVSELTYSFLYSY